MSANCPTAPFSWEAIGVVQNAHETLLPMGVSTYNAATTMAQTLASFAVTPVSADVVFHDVNPPGGPQRPERPDFPLNALSYNAPGDPPAAPTFTPHTPKLDDAGKFNADAPIVDPGRKPTVFDKDAPGPAPRMPVRAEPDDLAVALPNEPLLEPINIPAMPPLNIPNFTAQPPVDNETLSIIDTWEFTPEEYTSALLEKVKAKIDWGLDGGTGLPAAIQDALWARARERVDIEEARAIQQAVDEMGARGFTEPNGILNQRIEMVRQNNQNQRLALSRDLVIEEAKLEIDNLRFMIQQGIALEGTLIQLHINEQQMYLQAAQFTLDASIRVFEAKAALIRLRYDIFQAKAAVYRTQVEAALAKVEIFKAQIEVERVRGEINEQRVRLYLAQIQAVNAQVEVYNGKVKAFTALIESDVAKINGFGQEVSAFKALVDANVAEWNGFNARVTAEVGKANAYDALVRAYAARVAAVSDKNRASIDVERLHIQQHEAQLRTHVQRLEVIRTAIQQEQARVGAAATAFNAQAQVFAADAQVEQSISAALDRRYGLDIQKSAAAAQTAVQNAQMQIQQNVQLSGLQLQAFTAATQVLSQLAASVLSGVNYSAQIGYTQQGSVSCSTQNSYSY